MGTAIHFTAASVIVVVVIVVVGVGVGGGGAAAGAGLTGRWAAVRGGSDAIQRAATVANTKMIRENWKISLKCNVYKSINIYLFQYFPLNLF